MRAFFLLLFAVLSYHTAYGQTIVNLTVSNDKEKHVSNIPVKIIACDSLFTHTTDMDGQVSFTILSPDCRRVKVLIKSNTATRSINNLFPTICALSMCMYRQSSM